jgi:copper chaperone CopZ
MRTKIFIFTMLALITSSASAETIKAAVNGMVCSFCATGIEKTFMKETPVASIDVDLDKKLVTITTKPNQTLDDAKITTLINNAGYSVTSITREE